MRRRKRRDGPAGERIGAFEVELVALFDEALAVAPFVYTVLKVRVEDFHGYQELSLGSPM